MESHHINSNRKGADSALKSQLRLGKLNFIDLAGTERQDAQGRHKVVHSPEMTEMHNINLSLTALGAPLTTFFYCSLYDLFLIYFYVDILNFIA